MDSGKENDNDDFQTVIRHSRQKNSHDRDRGRRQMFPHQDGRGKRQGGERDRQYQNHRQGQSHGVSSHAQKEQQQPSPTVQSSLTNGSGSYVNGLTVKRSSGGVTNGSICSESGSSSLGTAESTVHSTNSNGLPEVETGNNNGSGCNELPGHVRHLSGGSLSGSASTCETDNVNTDIAQSPEELNNKSQFIVAPPPAVNPWRVNVNAASIIAKKTPASESQHNIIPRPSSLVDPSPSQTTHKKPVTAMNGGKRTEKEKTKTISTSTQLTNNTSVNSQKENEFKTVTRTPQRRSFRDRGRRVFQPESRGRRQGERDRDKQQLPHAVPSQQQPPTNPPIITSAISTNGTSSNYPNGLSVRSNGGVKNGSVCSESGSSSLGAPESLIHANSNGVIDVNTPLINDANSGVPNHIRHSSGESLSGSASSLETDVHNIAQSPEESNKPQFIVAPIPIVNPWRANSNAASIIAKKATIPASHIPLMPIPQTSVAPPTSQKEPVTAAVIGEKGPDKDKTKINAIVTSTTAESTNSSANSQTVEQSPACSTTTKTRATPKSTTEVPQQSQRKDIQEQAPKPRRAFAAVTRNQRGGFGKDSKTGAPTKEDWPTLQEALVSPTTSTPNIAQSKSVIGMTHELGKTTRRTSTAECSTDSEYMTLQQRKQKLPSDKWPSISAAGDNAKIPHSLINNNSIVVNDDTPSDVSNSGDVGVQLSTKKLQNGINQETSENGSLSSSDDNEHGLVDNELDADASTGAVRKGKKSKQKWVPLSLPETPSSKSRARRDRSSTDREWEKERDTSNNNKPKAKAQSNKEDVPVNIEGRSNHTYVARGRGRNNGIRGRAGRGRGGSQHWNYPREGGDLNGFSTDPDYTDYPADYTTLPTMYPLAEFIMPYMNYYPAATYTSPPPTGPVTEDAQISPAYVPVDGTVVSDMVKKQIEYYFSEENLEKDFYLRRKMDEEGFLPVSFIATFPRVKNMTQDYNMVIQAIQASPGLELKEDLSCLRTIYDPTKWPILDETTVGLPLHPKTKMTAPPVSSIAYPAPNGFVSVSVSLSGSFTPTPTVQTPSIAEKLNPNVPEFVPKAKIAEIL